MDFFDNALNKAKETIDVVSKKTEDFVTLEKQKFDLSSIKSKLEKDYVKLGKYYFSVLENAESVPEETAATVEQIKEKLERIEKLEIEIESAKNKKICPECKAAIDKNAVFCSNCGAKLVFDSKDE